MLALIQDPSSRVRSSAIQLLASFPGEAVDARLVGAAIDEARAAGERTLALGSLEQRQLTNAAATARLLVPGLLTESLPLREATVQLIARLAGRTVAVATEDKVALHAAWQGCSVSRSRGLVLGGAAGAALAALGLALRPGDEGTVSRPAAEAAERLDGAGEAAAIATAAVGADEPSNGLELVAVLREAGDVEGLLGQARGARGRDEPALRRQGVIALASLAAIPTAAAEQALEQVALDATAPSLERTTALAALWERGARPFVIEQGDRSDDPAIRSKARALAELSSPRSGF